MPWKLTWDDTFSAEQEILLTAGKPELGKMFTHLHLKELNLASAT